MPTTGTDGSKLAARALTQCVDYTIFNRTTGASPQAADCQQMARNIGFGNGIWAVFNKEGVQRPVAWDSSCVFSLTVPAGARGGDSYAYIGNGDISDLVDMAAKAFEDGGLIGADGAMHCVGSDETGVDIIWGISHA
ncbi:putative necrosis-inducing factor-domain-containing protein [Parachaetomium inaequale]|uniref:Necrosis-inducing factor-domain-containing protein n=1 Tax=Parachaetomium inaequale TaxID=2588326 RepID=A0AAN6SPP5_9PEZI|nr:putative necrosis-inducing factor-domain-containing protein [Parachaetomium inaequale]